MGKRFTEYSQFDLSQVNKDVLKKWDENQVFAKDRKSTRLNSSHPSSSRMPSSA